VAASRMLCPSIRTTHMPPPSQLAYMNELTEADIAAAEGEHPDGP